MKSVPKTTLFETVILKMIIDVLVNYRNGSVTIESKAANLREVRPSNIGLSKSAVYPVEQIEFVGEKFSTEDLEKMGVGFRPDGTTYRVINPLEPYSFEARAAARLVGFFGLKASYLLHPKTHAIRNFFRIDKIVLTLILPGYKLLSAQMKKDFDKELREIPERSQVIIESI
jgi:hypothetical protein